MSLPKFKRVETVVREMPFTLWVHPDEGAGVYKYPAAESDLIVALKQLPPGIQQNILEKAGLDKQVKEAEQTIAGLTSALHMSKADLAECGDELEKLTDKVDLLTKNSMALLEVLPHLREWNKQYAHDDNVSAYTAARLALSNAINRMEGRLK